MGEARDRETPRPRTGGRVARARAATRSRTGLFEWDPVPRPLAAATLGAALDTLTLECPWTAERARAWWEEHLPPSGPKPVPEPESYAPTERVESPRGP